MIQWKKMQRRWMKCSDQSYKKQVRLRARIYADIDPCLAQKYRHKWHEEFAYIVYGGFGLFDDPYGATTA